MSDGEQENLDVDIFEEQLNKKIENYFSSNNNELLTYEKLDNFLQSVDLYEYWNSEEEKDLLWQNFMNYNIDKKVDKNGVIKGIHDFLTKEDELPGENKEENLLTRISRMTLKNDGTGTVNRLVLNKYKQKAIDEYDCLDNQTLIQFRKIFTLLNISENNKNNIITIDKIEDICNKHKFIKIDKNEIIKYLSYLTCETKPIEEIQSIKINIDIFNEIDLLLQEKLIDEDLENYEEEEDGEIHEKKEDPLEILEDILQKIETTKDNTIVLQDMKNNLLNLNENMSETAIKIIQEIEDENQHENVSTIESLESIINQKMEKFDELFQTLNKDQKSNIQKVNSLKKCIISFNNDMNTLKEDYKLLFEKYNNNQELELDEEMERLLDENVALNQELTLKKEEVTSLMNERSDRDKQINDLYLKLDEDQLIEKELRKQISQLKNENIKQKEDYESLMDNFVNQIEKKQNEEMKERNRIKEILEKQLNSEKEKNNKNGNNNNSETQIKELSNIDNLNIPLTEKLLKKKKILEQLSSEQLIEYLLKSERLNISLKSEKKKKDELNRELEEKINQSNKILKEKNKQIGALNIDIKNYQSIITNLKNEVKSNEIFRPSIAMNGQMRISRMSKLNTVGINAMKFGGGFKNDKKKVNNSIEYYNNLKLNIKGKKNIQTVKLKDQNINIKMGKEQKTKLIEQKIHDDLYGKDENRITEEQNEEEIEQTPRKNKEQKKIDEEQDKKQNENNIINLEISKNTESTIEGHKMPFTNLEQNGIEFNIEKTVNNIGDNQFITIDNINDINLGGSSSKDMIEIHKDENNDDDLPKDKNSSAHIQKTQSFFESKPENNFEFFGKKEDNHNSILYNDDLDERETIQINQDQNFGNLVDMMIDGVKLNTGRESDNNTALKNSVQISKYGFDLENQTNNKDKTKHTDKLKSSENIIFDSKEKLNQLEINNDNIINLKGNENDNIVDNKNNEDKKDIEIKKESELKIDNKNNKGNEINKDNEVIKDKESKKDNNILEINKNNNIIIENKNKKNDIFEIKNNNQINIENQKEDDKNEIRNSDEIIVRKRTVIDTNNNKLNAEKVLGISNENSEEIKGRVRVKSIKEINNSNYTALGKKLGFISKDNKKEENNNNDYYSLFHEDKVRRLLNQKGDKAKENNIYSDQIYFVSNKKKLDKKLILLTPTNIYFLEKDNFNTILILNKNEISKVAVSNQNLNILSFVKKNGENVLLLTLRRMDLLYYLRDQYRSVDKPLRFTYEDSFKVMIKNKLTLFSVRDTLFTSLSNFDGAIKVGYLLKLHHYFRTFDQRLVVLTSIGLILFDDPTKAPERLYPIINSKIEKDLSRKYKRDNVFEITTIAGEVKVFAAYKEREMNAWLEEFRKVQENFKNKMKQLDTTNKIEFLDNKNSLSNVVEEDFEEELIHDLK